MTRHHLTLTVVGAALLAACSVRIDPDQALAYRCDPASPAGDAQCAGGWRCASDGLCHDPTLGAATSCESSADCLGGWHCGLDGLCYDRANAGAIPCRPEGEAGESDCADGWRCPSTGICQRVGVFGPYPCQTTADCEGGGHCGVAGRCYLRETAEGVACRQELDFDPEERDCAPEWVCAATSRCVDARAYDLQPNAPLAELEVEAVVSSPAFAADHVAAECYRTGVDTCTSATTAAVTVARGDKLELRRVAFGADIPAATVVVLPGPISALATTTLPGAGAPLQAYSLAVAGGQLLHLSWPPTGAPVTTVLGPPFVPERLHAPAALPWFVAVKGPELVLIARDGTSISAVSRLPDAQAGGPLAYGAISAVTIAGDFWLTALSSDGVFATRGFTSGSFRHPDGSTQPLPEWTPVRLPFTRHLACPSDDGALGQVVGILPGVGGASGSGSYKAARIAYVPADGALAGRALSQVLSVRVDLTPTACALMAAEAPSTLGAMCPSGSELLGYSGHFNVGLCRTEGAGGESSVAETTLGPSLEPPLRPSGLGAAALTRFDSSGQNTFAYGASDGQVIVRPFPTIASPVALRIDRAPSHLAQRGAERLAHAAGGTYRLTPEGFELLRADTVARCASVRGAESFQLYSAPSNGGLVFEGPAGAIAALADSSGVPTTCDPLTPVLAETVALRDGGTGVMVTARDRVWAQAPIPTAPGGTAWPVRIAPALFSTILSLATLRPSVDTPAWGAAFLIANGQVYGVRAESLTSWTSTALGSPSGEPFKVWADPQFGRVTYRDGTTYSLPLLSKLSGALPEAGAALRSLVEICGAAYGLGQTDLFRLESDGQWRPVPHPPAPTHSSWSKLLEMNDVLYGFTEEGAFFTLTDPSCPRP